MSIPRRSRTVPNLPLRLSGILHAAGQRQLMRAQLLRGLLIGCDRLIVTQCDDQWHCAEVAPSA